MPTTMASAGHRPFAHQERHQFDDLAGIEEVGRIERIAEIERFLVADEGQRQRQRRDDHQALVAAAEQRVETDQDQREQDDGGPARLERLQEEGDGAGEIAAHDQFDREHQDGRDRQR